MTRRKILLVDDDPFILQSYHRQLRRQFEISTATGGAEGLEIIRRDGPFAVVVSDMQMPGMNGLEFLKAVHHIAPTTVRMMLTGNADQRTAIDAVNEGNIYRFLSKPCSREGISAAFSAGLEHYRLVQAERELLTKTLSGSVTLLTDVLSLVNPVAFGRAASVRRLARQICRKAQITSTWAIEIAAMLSHVGCVTVSETTLAKIAADEPLTFEEMAAYEHHPDVGRSLISKIPRLEGVAEIIAYQLKRYDGSGVPNDDLRGDAIPLGARVLKLAVDAVHLRHVSRRVEQIMRVIRDREGWYDPQLVPAIEAALAVEQVVKKVCLVDLIPGMVLDEDVVSHSGDVLLTCGQEVNPTMVERLRRFAATDQGVRQPFRVCLAEEDPPRDDFSAKGAEACHATVRV